MGMISNAFDGEQRLDFAAIKAASLGSIESLVRDWLPAGCRQGDEWVAVNPTRGDKKAGSFSINLRSGVWSDFATRESGGDMIDLYSYLNRVTPLEAAKALGDILGVSRTPRTAKLHALPVAKRISAVMSPLDTLPNPAGFPARTLPDHERKPRFEQAGEEGPRRHNDEARRHVYKVGTTGVRIKIILRNDAGALNWYRVTCADGVTGWQLRKPSSYTEVPFVGVSDGFDPNPFDPSQSDKALYWAEGEKDADTLCSRGALAFTFGGVGDGLPSGCEEYVRGRDVVVLADNDQPGRNHAEKKAALAVLVAKSVRVIHLPELPPKGDVTDWIQRGGTLGDLEKIIAETPVYTPAIMANVATTSIQATPYAWTEPAAIPRRDFIYGRHLIRKFVSATIAPGGVGKSSLIVTESLAMVSGKPLLGVQPACRLRVWLWNLEDPHEEIVRHIQATAQHFGLSPRDIEGHLFVDSGRDQRLVITLTNRSGTTILEPVVDALVAELVARGVDHLVVDPFVSSHEAPENDNGAMDRIVKAWGRVAQRANCSIELVHHSRKSSAGETETTAESARGGKALTDGCRSVRVLNRMSKEEGETAGVDVPRSYFRVFVDKANLAPPAETSDWYHLKSIDLGNDPNGGCGDSVGVVVPWQWPDLMADVTVSDLRAVQAAISKGRYRASPQAGDWVGHAVADVLRLDLYKPSDKRKASNLLKVWLASGALKKQIDKDDKGNDRPFITVGEWANA